LKVQSLVLVFETPLRDVKKDLGWILSQVDPSTVVFRCPGYDLTVPILARMKAYCRSLSKRVAFEVPYVTD